MRYDIVLIDESGNKSTTRFPVDAINQDNVNRALRESDELVKASPGSVLFGVFAVREIETTSLRMVSRGQAMRSDVIVKRATELGQLRTTESGVQAVTCPIPVEAFRETATRNGWVFDGEMGIGPDGSVFEVRAS